MNKKTKGTQACRHHQDEWNQYVQKYKRQTASGSRRIFKQQDVHPWEKPIQVNKQPHDEPAEEMVKKNYFSPA